MASEFATTSLSSGGNGSSQFEGLDEFLARNPCTKFHNRQRGYIMCDVTPNTYSSDYKVIDKVTSVGGKTTSLAKFTVESGRPNIHTA